MDLNFDDLSELDIPISDAHLSHLSSNASTPLTALDDSPEKVADGSNKTFGSANVLDSLENDVSQGDTSGMMDWQDVDAEGGLCESVCFNLVPGAEKRSIQSDLDYETLSPRGTQLLILERPLFPHPAQPNPFFNLLSPFKMSTLRIVKPSAVQRLIHWVESHPLDLPSWEA